MASIPFLKEIANILLQPGEFDLQTTCIVFPNKRARLYLSKYIGELTDKPVWAPLYLTISELMEKVSGCVLADRLTLLFELFEAYCKVTGTSESFDAFYPYSDTLLADFDEIDKYLVNADDLFSNLSDLKALDGRFNYLSDDQVALIRRFWKTFNPEQVSEGQTVFISLWEALPDVYHEFRNRLSIKQMAYEGMAYRKAIGDLGTDDWSDHLSYRKYLFVGFNALNTCEETLFKHLKARNKAEFFWDYDSWYTSNEIHEAGFFIRRNMKSFPQTRPLNHENLMHKKHNVLFVPVSSNSGQATLLPHIFDKLRLHDPNQIERTALVLADESLLIPALYAIPEFVTDVNVTMGYPIAGSAICNLIDSLYELCRNSRKKTDGSPEWYFRDVLAIMSNPLLSKMYNNNIEQVRKGVLLHHMVYLRNSDILTDEFDEHLFNDSFNKDACKYLLDIITIIIRNLPSEHQGSSTYNSVQVELLFQVYTFLIRLNDVLSTQKLIPGPDVVFRLIRKMIRTMHVPFSGEPLSGLQVLGILETRTLDFDHVIILSANEGILPKSSEKPSFIPYNLRAGFGLSTPEHHDAIYAYYFYRLIQRAQDVALVYNGSSGGLQTGERSRFLHQLYYEMNLSVTEVIIESPIAQVPVRPIIIEKGENDLTGYCGETGRMLSPSAINEFFNCSLRFYFSRIAGIPQPEEATDEIDARLFGNLLHHALKLVYAGFGQSLITREKLGAVLKDEKIIYDALDVAFNKELYGDSNKKGNRKPEGFNLIVRQVIFAYIKQFIKTDQESCPFTILSLEERYAVTFPVMNHGVRYDVKVGGVIDRIDRREGKIRILDYKTGSVKNAFPTVESLFDGGTKLRNDAAFQVLLYAYVYERLHKGETIVPGLVFIRESHTEDFSSSLHYGTKREALGSFDAIRQEFVGFLNTGLTRLFNTDEPFMQTTNLQVCRFCPYAMICRREKNEQ